MPGLMPGLWQRVLSDVPLEAHEDLSYYHYQRITHCLPDSETDLIIERTFPLEAGLDRLNAMNFKKGCYIGQEPVARAHYQGVIRKKLMTVMIEGDIPAYGSKIMTVSGAEVGDLRSTITYNNEHFGIAMIRTEAILERLHCDKSSIKIVS
jgi:folate-binding protein YgfZ